MFPTMEELRTHKNINFNVFLNYNRRMVPFIRVNKGNESKTFPFTKDGYINAKRYYQN